MKNTFSNKKLIFKVIFTKLGKIFFKKHRVFKNFISEKCENVF